MYGPSFQIRRVSRSISSVNSSKKAIAFLRCKFHNYSTMSADDGSGVPKAEYKQLGKSGLRVSVPILGAMSFGDKRWQEWVIEEDTVRR